MRRPFDPHRFYGETLKANGIVSAFGVPDSSLSGLLSYFSTTKSAPEHIVTANEGAAVALAAGYYLSIRKVALSLAAKEVFGIPMLLMIGWRAANDFPFEEMPDTLSGARDAIARLVAISIRDNTPVALIVPRKTFLEHDHEAAQITAPMIASSNAKFEEHISSASDLPLSRETAIHCLLEHIENTDITVSSLGGNSRELYMLRKESGATIRRDFFCIGAMGHAFALAHGITMGFSSGRVFCIDGDGSFLMHIGNNAVLAGVSQRNVIHIVIYNGMHSSTGNQPLMIKKDDFLTMAEGLPYKHKFFVCDTEGLKQACQSASQNTLIVVSVNDSVRKNLPRPSESPQELKTSFMKSFD